MYASNKARNPIHLWYNTAQLEVTSLTEWTELSEQLYSILSHSDTAFHTLSAQDKQHKLREALREFSHNNNSTMLRISRAVSAAVSESLSRHRLSDRQSSLLTASEYLLDKSGNASDLKSQFNKYFNGDIPPHMRGLVWKSCLYTPNLERVIELTIKRQEQKGHTGNNQLKIKSLLTEFSSFIGSVSDTVGELMAESLYYYTEVIYQNSQPKMQHIKLLYPFIVAVLDSPSTSTLLTNHTNDPLMHYSPSKSNSSILSKILALYISFLQKAPEIIQSDSPTRGAEMWLKEFSLRVTSLVKGYDALLYHFLCGLTSDSEPQLVSSLAQLFKPFLQDLFVGYMQTSLVLFLWDNCFLCLDTPSIQFLPFAAACWLVILKRDLMLLTRFDQLLGLLETNSASISVRNMQDTLQKLAPDLKSIFTAQTPLPTNFKRDTLVNQTRDNSQVTDTQTIYIATNIQTNINTTVDLVESIELVANDSVSEIQIEQTSDVQSERNISVISEEHSISPVHVETHRDTPEDNSTNASIYTAVLSDREDGQITIEFWEKIINRFQKGLLNIARIEVEPNIAL